ncbi:cobalt ECF transporter T component CbiQ [Nocardiopsis salina]|uniref:cobalt ECF transporter T component CbiQ n=1 Tax=Nocardiopsis salina TaxID=245836 RepID=UPI00034A9069|nr:cobalt ECF transporter T component CbiQ [Nocardiopsis salina]
MMHAIDHHHGAGSPVHRWDPRCKLVSLGALALACAVVTDPFLVPAVLAVAASLVLLSRLPAGFVLARLRRPGAILFCLVVALPLVSGPTVLLELGPVSLYREGTLELFLIAGRFTAVVTLALIAFATAPMHTSITALRALRLPQVLTDMLLLTHRYLQEIDQDLSRMRRSARLRAFAPRRPDRRTLATVGALGGSLLVRSHDRSTRVHRAMLLRGHGNRPPGRHTFRAGTADLAGTAAALTAAAALITLEAW